MPPYSVPFDPEFNMPAQPTTESSPSPQQYQQEGADLKTVQPVAGKDQAPTNHGDDCHDKDVPELTNAVKEIAIHQIDNIIDQTETVETCAVTMIDPATAASLHRSSMNAYVRKAGVAVAGGAMVGLGLVMIPLPTPCGALVAASGMGVLATEFPEAQRVLDHTKKGAKNARDKLVSSIEKSAIEEQKELERERVMDEAKKAKVLEELESKQDVVPAVVVEKSEFSNMFMNPKEKERQSRLTASATKRPTEVVTPEDHIDNARRTIRRGASRFGQSMLPFLKKMDDMELPVPAMFTRKPEETPQKIPKVSIVSTPVGDAPQQQQQLVKPDIKPIALQEELKEEATLKQEDKDENAKEQEEEATSEQEKATS